MLDSLSGANVGSHFRIAAIGSAPTAGAVIGPGQEGIVFLDASVAGGARVLADFGGNHVVERFSYAGHVYYAFYAGRICEVGRPRSRRSTT